MRLRRSLLVRVARQAKGKNEGLSTWVRMAIEDRLAWDVAVIHDEPETDDLTDALGF